MTALRRSIKRTVMYLFLRGYLPSWFVVMTFRVFRLRSL